MFTQRRAGFSTLTFPYRDSLQLIGRECLRVRLTGNLARGFNPWHRAFD
jgi:hypothetical protein